MMIAVGRVRNDLTEPTLRMVDGDLQRDPDDFEDRDSMISDIVMEPEFEDALDGVEGFSHLIVVFLTERASPGQCKVHPAGMVDVDRQGIFATRSPVRPNPIAITTVRLISREGSRLRVTGLDSIDGSVVLDIKPHIPQYDAPVDARLSPWMMELRERFDR